MIEHLATIERDAQGTSRVHLLDARVKILITFAAIITMVAMPYTPAVYPLALCWFILFTIWWSLSGLSPRVFFWRYLMTLPFGMFIIIFQIFFENPYYDVFTPIVTLPFGISIYAQSVEFATILALKFTACIIWVILLSSTTPMEELLKGARRLGLPSVMALSLGMMIRYLFVFAEMYAEINNALAVRHFNAFSRNLPYRYRMRILAYTIGTMFLRSYEQGERTYTAMLCRGYGKDAYEHLEKKSLAPREYALTASMIIIFCAASLGIFLFWA
ncbi:cobalt ECF transporter T component CbiQ [Methanogenium organophilum]|uniref:Cobalt ECF transporter T component CbiQ n=1 Tax=Methanogenium organophilum TaxID=2199 RepID=A0A9X9T9A9_METOG|nr:cobalt ECF transporter T component CbiQ [Methanogenium organophilum]WAI02455.1 cobalt ECF transporter T component CbiQ [Methanogenium organophilum]